MSEKVIVTVNEGKLRGFKQTSAYSGVEYYSFLGVPYGQPTGRNARFKDPVKVNPWNTTLDATVEKTGCVQHSIIKRMIVGSEDCLYNNIHTPKLPTSKQDPLKPVIVLIHPGGYFHGSADPHYYGSPEYLMNHDIVYVAVSHRLHLLGYLNLGMKECSGNQGLKDITLSLQWIKENITNFGGDPENVTILGVSSGAIIVHCLLLSQSAKGLYHKAVLMGLYLFCPVIIARNSNVRVAYEVACRLGYDGPMEDKKRLLRFFKKLKIEQFIPLRSEYSFNPGRLPIYPASPFIYTPDSGENQFLGESMRSLIPSTNRVPVIIGFCEREAAMGLSYYQGMKKSEATQEGMKKSEADKLLYNSLRHNDWGWSAHLNDDEINMIQQEIESFYLNGESIEHASQSTTCDIMTDATISDLYESLINVISEDLPSDVYVYQFKYDGLLCGMKHVFQPMLERPLKGTFHAADFAHWSCVVDHIGKTVGNITREDRQVIDTFTTLITTFANTGNPNFEGLQVEWKPTTPEKPAHLCIDIELEMKDGVINGERLEFWHKLKKKFNYE